MSWTFPIQKVSANESLAIMTFMREISLLVIQKYELENQITQN